MKLYEINPTEKIQKIYGFSEPASQKMEILVEMYHNTVVSLSYILFAIIFAIVITVYKYRSSKNQYAMPFQKSVEYLVDALFVFMPIIIIYYLAVPAVGFIINNDKLIAYLDTPMTLEVVGHQWYWSYGIYGEESNYVMEMYNILPLEKFQGEWKVELDQLIDLEVQKNLRCFEVNKHVILPMKELIKCEVHSEDVIHSWALPQLGVKVDAIPGRVQLVSIKAERTGVFYGQCSELCGVNHAFMPAVLEFVEEDSFVDWMMKEMQYRPYKLMLKEIEGCHN